MIARIAATQAADLPHEFDEADDGYCRACGYDEDEDIHRVRALRQVAGAQRLRREFGS
jgi:hypothetical protein